MGISYVHDLHFLIVKSEGDRQLTVFPVALVTILRNQLKLKASLSVIFGQSMSFDTHIRTLTLLGLSK